MLTLVFILIIQLNHSKFKEWANISKFRSGILARYMQNHDLRLLKRFYSSHAGYQRRLGYWHVIYINMLSIYLTSILNYPSAKTLHLLQDDLISIEVHPCPIDTIRETGEGTQIEQLMDWSTTIWHVNWHNEKDDFLL